MFKAALFLLSLLPTLALADWPQFRGPSGDGNVPAGSNLPLEWSEAENVIWRVDIPGKGWSSPVVQDGVIYLTAAVASSGDQDRSGVDRTLTALALNAKTGETIWTTPVFEQDGGNAPNIHKKNSHASPTPLVRDNRLYVHFGHQGTACLSLDGSVVWRNQELSYKPVHGNGGSPLVVGNHLIFSCDGPPDPFVAALDIRDGTLAWRTDRNTDASRKFSFSTPILIQAAGRDELILPGSGNLYAYDPATGSELWRSSYGQGYSVVPRPVFGHGLVFVSSGYDRPVFYAVKPGGSGDVTDSHVEWSFHEKGAPRNSSPLLVGNELYLFDDKGIGTCLDAKSGEIHWQERLGSDTSASAIHSQGRIYSLDETGTCHVIDAGREFKRLAENPLGERALASMAVDGNDLLIRTETGLFRIGSPES